VEGRPEGACSPDGRIAGSYLHGIFAADDFRRAYLTGLGEEIAAGPSYEATVEATLDALAEHLERHLDLDLLWRIAQGEGATAESRTQSQSL
jgi:adenosylcobyric acid synthase